MATTRCTEQVCVTPVQESTTQLTRPCMGKETSASMTLVHSSHQNTSFLIWGKAMS